MHFIWVEIRKRLDIVIQNCCFGKKERKKKTIENFTTQFRSKKKGRVQSMYKFRRRRERKNVTKFRTQALNAFVNSQIIFRTFLFSSNSKWNYKNHNFNNKFSTSFSSHQENNERQRYV